ncbi:dihydroorotate dehydrogenase [Candidatus Gottesmanbacteria bacterium]|nr:dihydroorotate dehydrogenase [Candidatus Gottesmanbacteria bacterium]
MTDLSIKFCSVTFPNPLILPSGIAQEIPQDHLRAVEAGAGGITLKSLTPLPREGYPFPRTIKYEHGFLNAVGLRNPGIDRGLSLVKDFISKVKIPTIVSLWSDTIEGFAQMVQKIAPLNPPFIELNLSCPHVHTKTGAVMSMQSDKAADAVKAAKRYSKKIPLIAKLTPNVEDIAKVAKRCEEEGADAICVINTVGPGMVIDIKTKKPVLGNKRGGVSGPAIKPVAIRCVYDVYDAVKIPIIGMGSITTWQDAVEMMMAGATLVGVGSAVFFRGYKVYGEIKQGLSDYIEKEGIKNLKELVGMAH